MVTIRPYSKNAKKHPDAQLKQIALSLKEYGWQQPIVVDKNNEIIVGHGRYFAYEKYPEGIEKPWIQKADKLTPEQVRGYRLMDNKTNESDWDMALAIEELKELDTLGFDIELTGFDKDLLIEADEKDDVIPTDAPTRAKLGDVWLLGEHRVMCGDSTKKEDVERLMDGKEIELLFTSPPYADMREYEGGKDLGVEHLSDFIVVYAPYCNYQVVNLGIKRDNHETVSYWDDYIISHEWMFVFGKDFKDINRVEKRKTAIKRGKMERSVRQADGSMEYSSFGKQGVLKEMESVYYQVAEMGAIRKLHPATFPIDLADKYIRSITNEGQYVTDPFLGSGSTLIAAEKTGRICYGMELDPKYCDVILKRWEDYTGKATQKQ